MTFCLYLILSTLRAACIFHWNKIVKPKTPWVATPEELDFMLHDICYLLIYGPAILYVIVICYAILLVLYQWWNKK